MRELCRIVVEADPNLCSPNRRRKVRTYIQHSTAHKQLAQVAWRKAKRPVAPGPFPITVNVIVRRGNRMDEFNAWAGMKHVIDGLFVKAITPDDSAKYVRQGSITIEVGPQWKKFPHVEVIVLMPEASP